MTEELVVSTIEASPFAENLDSTECRILAGIAELKHLENGEHLTVEGDDDEYLYIVVSGSVEVHKKLSDSSREILCRLSQNMLGGISGFVDGQKRLADMIAIGNTSVVAISREKFKSLIPDNAQVVYKVMCTLVQESLRIVQTLDNNIVELDAYLKTAQGHY